MSKRIYSNIMLLITSIIWGSSFVAQKAGTSIEPFTYNGIRSLVGAAALIPVILIFSKINKNSNEVKGDTPQYDKKTLWIGGIACGIVIMVASTLQQFGIYFETDAGKAGFITTLYIVIVPIFGIFLGKRVGLRVWGCVILGAIGFYFLTMAGHRQAFTIQPGDIFVLLCAVVFSIHILVIDHFSPKCDGVKLSCIQFFISGMLCCILMFIFETPNIAAIIDCAFPILYAGIMSSGVAYTLQIIGQKHAEPTSASLILSLESVFAVLSGVLLLNETMTKFELFGCIIIFIAVIIAQLPSKNENKI